MNLYWDDDVNSQPQDASTFCLCFTRPEFCNFYMASPIL